MTDINKAQAAVAAYCEGDIGLGDRLVESAAAARQGLEREDGTVLGREQTIALLRARAIDALDVVDGRLERSTLQGPADMVERISALRDQLLVEHERAYQTDERLFLADTPREESLGYSTVEDRHSSGEGLDAGVLSDRASQIASPNAVTGEPAPGTASSEPDPDFDRPAEPPIGYGE